MNGAERHYLEVLKQRVAERFFEGRGIKPVEEWSVPDIEAFRDELKESVGGSISEKWFYTHFKGKEQEKLPRIDTLNLLSRYTGYADWEELKAKNPYEERSRKRLGEDEKKEGRLPFMKLPLVLIATLLIGMGSIPLMMKNEKERYRVCFEDADRGAELEGQDLQVKWLRKDESPLMLKGDSGGCFTFPSDPKELRFIVQAPYYRNDTFIRKLENLPDEERIPLERDDRALMIRSFSQPDQEEIEKHRKRLERMIAEDARIYQVHDRKGKGIELYNKEEFIDKLTMPLSSLKAIEVIEMRYDEHGEIRSIRFQQASRTKDE